MEARFIRVTGQQLYGAIEYIDSVPNVFSLHDQLVVRGWYSLECYLREIPLYPDQPKLAGIPRTLAVVDDIFNKLSRLFIFFSHRISWVSSVGFDMHRNIRAYFSDVV